MKKAEPLLSMLSGATGTNFNIMSNLVASNTATVAKSVGCTGDPDSGATVQCLRNVPLEKLMDMSVAFARQRTPPFGELTFYPSYDGDYIPDRPSVLLRKGAFVKGMLDRLFHDERKLKRARNSHYRLLDSQRRCLVRSANYHRRCSRTCKFPNFHSRNLSGFTQTNSFSLSSIRL